jgi:hypothetical protein
MNWRRNRQFFRETVSQHPHAAEARPGLVHHRTTIFACGAKIRLQSIEKTSEKKSFDKANGMA